MIIKEGKIIFEDVTIEELGKIEAFVCSAENHHGSDPIASLDILKGGQKKGSKTSSVKFDIALKVEGLITLSTLRTILTKIV